MEMSYCVQMLNTSNEKTVAILGD